MRIARILLAVVVLLLAVVLGLVIFVLARDDVQAGRLRREVAPRVLITDRTTNVTLTKLRQPPVACPAARRASKVVLLIDRSGSMADNAALEQAMGAAQTFVDTVDLNANRVAIVLFTDQAQTIQPLSQDEAALLAATTAPVLAEGDTDIANALIEAAALLRAESAPNVAPVIVLLTDGGSDPVDAAAVGAQLRDEGVRVIAVSLVTQDSNPSLLRSLVSAPDDYHESASPAELATLYADVAEQLNQAVAFDVTLTETAGDALTVWADSPQPPAPVADHVITWDVPSLSADEARFTYTADVSGFGLRAVNGAKTTMTYTDCLAGAIATTLPPGPHVLVLPPWLLGLLAALLALPFLLAWFRRPKPVTPSAFPTSIGPVPTTEPPDILPAWLRRLDDSRQTLVLAPADPATAADELVPTMLIGLGPVGRIVLSQVAQALRARHNGRLPDDVRLMQIDVRPKGVAAPALTIPDYLEPAEWTVLEPDLEEVAANIRRQPGEWPYLTWYEPTATEDYARAAGRMALFYDLKDGGDHSILWRGLTRLSTKLDNPKLRLVGSTFDDVGSGMLVDMAWLMQLNKDSQVDVELWLSGPVGRDWPARVNQPHQTIRSDDQHARTLATLRELERFESNDPAPFSFVGEHHTQAQFRKASAGAVVQTLYLFLPPDQQTDLDDHLATMADGLLAALYAGVQQKIVQHMNRTASQAFKLVNSERTGMASSMGAYSIRLPVGQLDEALAWRAVYELLFEARVGLHPMASLTSNGSYEIIDPETAPGPTPDDPTARDEAADIFVTRFRHHYDSEAFLFSLIRQTNDRLNGEASGDQVLNRVGSLVRTRRWLQAVRQRLNLEAADSALDYIRDLDQQLEGWQEFMEQQLHPWVERRRRAARDRLGQLTRQTGRKWALPSELDWPAYRRNVRSWLEPRDVAANDPFLRGARRFGWFVAYDPAGPRVSVQLWAPPGDFIWSRDGAVDPTGYPLAHEPSAAANRLYHLLAPLARLRSTWEQTQAVAGTVDAQEWLDRAAPRLPINGQEASQKMSIGAGIAEKVLLVAPREGLPFLTKLKDTTGKPTVEMVETHDFAAITVLKLRDRVPLSTCLGLYDEETWQQHLTTPGLYVRRGEQMAAAQESGGRLSSRFVGWLDRDSRLVDLYARACLFDVLDVEDDRVALPGLGQWPGHTAGDGLAALFDSNPSRWPPGFDDPGRRVAMLDELARATVEKRERLWSELGKRDHLRLAESAIVELAASQTLSDRDLALYLRGIIRQL